LAKSALAKKPAAGAMPLAQVMRGGYIAGTFRHSDAGLPECRHIVDVSEDC